jgi:hypothetical protein
MSQLAHVGGERRRAMRARALGLGWPRSTAFACAAGFAGTLAVALLQGEKPFYADSHEYWSLGSTFTVHGHFSLLNFRDAARGYVLPLINSELQRLGDDLGWTASSMAKLSNVFTFTAIGTVLAPALMRTVWPQQSSWGPGRRLTLTALLVVFWSGYLNFPLSDFPGLAMALLTLVAVARVDSPGWMLVAGLALGMSIDMRAAYIPLLPVVAGLVVWAWFDQRGTRHASRAHRALCAGLLAIGFATVSLPQSLSAHRYYGTWSFVPSASQFEPAGTFLTPGMVMENRDTLLGSGPLGAGGSLVMYGYPAGQRLLEEQPERRIATTSQYLGLFVSHPLVMGGLIAGHVINSLDPLYSTPYIEHLNNGGRVWGRIGGFLLVFVALLRVLWPAARRCLGPGRLRFLVALMLCCVTTVPTDIERRYMLPLYLLSYALALMPRWPQAIAPAVSGVRRLRTPAVITAVFLVYTSVVWYFTSEAIDHMRLIYQ